MTGTNNRFLLSARPPQAGVGLPFLSSPDVSPALVESTPSPRTERRGNANAAALISKSRRARTEGWAYPVVIGVASPPWNTRLTLL